MNIKGTLIPYGLSITIFLSLSACQNPDQYGQLSDIQATVSGIVMDESGAIVSGARVKLVQGGTSSVQLAMDDGEFSFEVYQGDYTLRVEAQGYEVEYLKGWTSSGTADEITVWLRHPEVVGRFDSDDFTLIQHDDVTIALVGNSFVYPDGGPVSGPIDYQITYFSIVDGDAAIGLPNPDGELFGIVNAEFYSEGILVNLAADVLAEIEIPLPWLDCEHWDLELPAQHFDGDTHTWEKEGNTQLIPIEDGCLWSAQVGHFSSWSGGDRVVICHIPPGNPANAHTIEIGASALRAHLAHGDYPGHCEGETDPTDPEDPADPEDPEDPQDPTCIETTEICDGFDNDCDGVIDEADEVCPTNAICVEMQGYYTCMFM